MSPTLRCLKLPVRLVARINGIGRLQNASFKPVEFADAYEDARRGHCSGRHCDA